MLRNLFGVTLATLAAVLLQTAPVHAWGAYHAGYTHVGPNGVYHAGTTAAGGYRGYGAAGGTYHAGYTGAGAGGAYHTGHTAVTPGGNVYHTGTTEGYRYSPGYSGAAYGGYHVGYGGYGYVR